MVMETQLANGNDDEVLAEIRARSMKPSLEAIGRYDEARVRSRFLATFRPEETTKLLWHDELAGFFVVRRQPDHLYLNHLYIDPAFQNRRLGTDALALVKAEAIQQRLPIRLRALKHNKANAFYINQGFWKTHEDDLDFYYEWR